MSNNFRDITYSGPDLQYKPHIGVDYLTETYVPGVGSKGGWHDIDYLRSLLDNLEKMCNQVYLECKSQLSKYSLKVDINNKLLLNARMRAFPTDASDKLGSSIDEKVERYLLTDPNIAYTGGNKWFNEVTGKYEWTNPSTNKKESYDTMTLLREAIRSYLNTNENYGILPDKNIPDTISFHEYEYYKYHNQTTAADYVTSYYEEKMRAPGGSNALDISYLSLMTNNEIKRIRDFLDKYLGDIDDPTEFRTLELFQSWAEDAYGYTKDLWQVITGQISTEIPRSEMDQLDSQKAVELQALFQVKLNVINGNIKDLISQIHKNWEDPSSYFYNNNLGPALKFQTKVGRKLSTNFASEKTPVISAEVLGSLSGLKSNFTVLLSDQTKRNTLYSDNIENILMNIAQRDSYIKYIDQLSVLGKKVSSEFTNTDPVMTEAFQSFNSPLQINTTNNTMAPSNVFQPLHSLLVGVDSPDAHPQYLLRSGGENSKITGDIIFEEGVKIDGIIPSKHAHTGLDGSVKIKGSDIEFNSVTDDNVDNSVPSTNIPSSLSLNSKSLTVVPPGITRASAKLSFVVDTTNIVQYEFEVTPLPALVQPDAEIETLINNAKIFKDLRGISENITELPSPWESPSGLLLDNVIFGKDNKGILLIDDDAELYLNVSDPFSLVGSTVIYCISRDSGWQLSPRGVLESDEFFQVALQRTGEEDPDSTRTRILTSLNSSNTNDIGNLIAETHYKDDTNNTELFEEGTGIFTNLGDVYQFIDTLVISISMKNTGIIVKLFGSKGGIFEKLYKFELANNNDQRFNRIKFTTKRDLVSVTETPIVRLHAVGVWSDPALSDLSENDEISKIASYLLA